MITIAEAREKCKNLVARVPRDVLIIAVLILASSLSFGLGYLAGLDAGQVREISLETSPLTATTSAEHVVASKGGTKYYLPGCAGVDRISVANKVWFVSPAAALAAGYTPAANCKGI
jgi:hypothetical protein